MDVSQAQEAKQLRDENTPAPCPTPPSPLKPEMERMDFVVCSSERKTGGRSKLSPSDFVTYAAWRTCQAYISSMDVFTQRRIVTLRHEIASLQHNNEVYRLQRHHTQLEVDTNDVRRFRLLAGC
jgi:hypothetical protein